MKEWMQDWGGSMVVHSQVGRADHHGDERPLVPSYEEPIDLEEIEDGE